MLCCEQVRARWRELAGPVAMRRCIAPLQSLCPPPAHLPQGRLETWQVHSKEAGFRGGFPP